MNDAAPRSSYKKSAATRQAIFDAAISLMKEKGFRGTTVREISQKAGVAVGSFYSYFASKNDVLWLIYQGGEDYFSTVVAPETAGPDACENIRIFFRHYARLNIETGVETLRVMFTPDNKWFTTRKKIQDVLESIILAGQSSGQLRSSPAAARLVDDLFLYMRGVCYDWCSLGGAYDLEERMAECLELMLPGIKQQ